MGSFFLRLISAFSLLPLSVGNHTDYSGGGGDFDTGDYGGSYGFDFYSGGGGGSSSSDGFGLIPAIIVAVVILFIFYLIKKYGNTININQSSQAGFNGAVANRNGEIERKIKEHDPDFSTERFLSWAEQVFVRLQQAWTERDWKKARPFESESLFNLHKSQLDEYIRNGTINIMENVCVNESYLCDYADDGNYEYLTVFMNTRYNDYIVKEDTREVVKGDPNRTYHVQYKLKFMRTLGVKTGQLSNKSTASCPNCGAPVDVNAAGQCAYCGTVITNGEHDWVLCNMDDIAQY